MVLYLDNEHKSKQQFFSNREIWEQVFGKDGRSGAIGELHDKVEEKFDKLEEMICIEFTNARETMDSISEDLKKYNGLHEKVQEVKAEVKDQKEQFETHVGDWNTFRMDSQTQEAIGVALDEEHQKGIDEADKIFNKRMKVIRVYVAVAAAIAGVIAALIVKYF